MYDEGFVFNQLEHLKLCKCKEHSPDLLVRLLKDSSNLQQLDIFHMDDYVSLFVELLLSLSDAQYDFNIILMFCHRIMNLMKWFT